MAHPLDGARAKVARAGDHLEMLDAMLARFVKDGGYSLVAEPDADTGEYVYRIYSHLKPPVPPPLTASAMVGDVLHNLRSALDLIVWQLAETPTKQNQFPVFDDPKAFKEKRNRYLRSVPREHWAQIESYQPYPGRPNFLAAVATLNDVDKHHLLLPGVTAVAGGRGRFRGRGVESLTVKGRDWTPFEDGAEVYRIAIEPSGDHVQVNAEVPYTIVFRDPEGPLGVSTTDLRTLRVVVSNIVESFAGAFAAHAAPSDALEPPFGSAN